MALTKIEDATITDPSVATIVIPFETCGGLPRPWTQVESPSDRWPKAADGGGLPIITYHCLEHGDVIPCVAFSRVTTPNR